jgi:NAD(P)-dependent dehydrogenase (short-subunit alcohol dehydrogenase family)/ribulose-5-phosphate 4-epimerase/fuculose-1-phosphate aldolase
VLHTHADATAALIDNPRSRQHVEKCFGGAVGLVPYQRPGFALAKATADLYERAVKAGKPWRAILLDKHGLITWGETGPRALAETAALLATAYRYVTKGKAPRRGGPLGRPSPKTSDNAWLAVLRGEVSRTERQVLHWDASPAAIAFSQRPDAFKLCMGGPATPDHLLYSKPAALYIDAPEPATIAARVAHYRKHYDLYFKAHAPKGSVKLDSAPRVTVVKGQGVLTTGKDPKSARIAADIFRHSAWVRVQAQGLGGYQPINLKQIGDFEYWPLENYKLTLAPPEKELARQVALVTGAGRGIGKACAERLAAAGASVAVLDRDGAAAQRVAAAIEKAQGPGRALGIAADITDAGAVHAAFEAILRMWGGLDIVVQNAGIAVTGNIADLDPADWRASLEVNATGHFLIAREAAGLFKLQGLGGSMVFISTKNVPSPSAGFGAYSASKAAQTQLAKVLALELAPLGVRVNAVTPDGVFEDSGLWEQIGPSRAKAQGMKPSDLKANYIQRNLLKKEVRPSDVAEAVLFLCSERSSRTTGTLLPVDGGLKDAFLR